MSDVPHRGADRLARIHTDVIRTTLDNVLSSDAAGPPSTIEVGRSEHRRSESFVDCVHRELDITSGGVFNTGSVGEIRPQSVDLVVLTDVVGRHPTTERHTLLAGIWDLLAIDGRLVIRDDFVDDGRPGGPLSVTELLSMLREVSGGAVSIDDVIIDRDGPDESGCAWIVFRRLGPA